MPLQYNWCCAVQLLARQSLSLGVHAPTKGNLDQLLKYKADPCLTKWLASKANVYTCGEIQNEFLNLISTSVVRGIAEQIRSLPHLQFSIMTAQELSQGRSNRHCA